LRSNTTLVTPAFFARSARVVPTPLALPVLPLTVVPPLPAWSLAEASVRPVTSHTIWA